MSVRTDETQKGETETLKIIVMRLEIHLKSFIVAVMWLTLAVALACGKVQELIRFNSVDAEIICFVMSSGIGIVCLVTALKIQR